jgi:hypothetical protein
MKILIRYPNISGAIVRVCETDDSGPRTGQRAWAVCTGCLSTGYSVGDPVSVRTAGDWAQKHATECTALPPLAADDDTDDDRASVKYMAAAGRLFARALSRAERDGTPIQMNENDRSTAEIHAALATVAARLAEVARQIERTAV